MMHRHSQPSGLTPWTESDLESLVKLARKYGAETVAFTVRRLVSNLESVDGLASTGSNASARSRMLPVPTRPPAAMMTATAVTDRSIQSVMMAGTDQSCNLSRAGSVAGSIFSQSSVRTSVTDYSDVPTPDPTADTSTGGDRNLEPLPTLDRAAETRQTSSSPNHTERQAPSPPIGQKKYWCPLCYVHGVSVPFTRKADCKRHICRDHCTNSIWKCFVDDCGLIFDSKKCFIQHVKFDHELAHPSADTHRSWLSTQLVYGCGFEGCKERVFEALHETDAPSVVDKYGDHVAKHFDEDANVRSWTHSTRIQHLMYQSGLKKQWKAMVSKEDRARLHWEPKRSPDLQQKLEYRTFKSTDEVLHMALTLGSFNSPPPDRPLPRPPVAAPEPTSPLHTISVVSHQRTHGSTVPHVDQTSESLAQPDDGSFDLPIMGSLMDDRAMDHVASFPDQNTFFDFDTLTPVPGPAGKSPEAGEFLSMRHLYGGLGTPADDFYDSTYSTRMPTPQESSRYASGSYNNIRDANTDYRPGDGLDHRPTFTAVRANMPPQQGHPSLPLRRRPNGEFPSARPASVVMGDAPPLEEAYGATSSVDMVSLPDAPSSWASHGPDRVHQSNPGDLFRSYFDGRGR